MIVGGVTLFAQVAQSVHCSCLVRCQSLAVVSLTHGVVLKIGVVKSRFFFADANKMVPIIQNPKGW